MAKRTAKANTNTLTWWKHQRDWFADKSRFRVCCKARQIGMSMAIASEALNDALYGETTIIVSASQRQASEIIRKATMLLPIVKLGEIEVVAQSTEKLELSTGGRVISVPASAATSQGFTGNVVIDEAAWIPDLDSVWQAIVPTISTQTHYRLSVISTPGPQSGMFYKLWHNEDPAWSKHRVDVYDACKNGASHNIAQLKSAVADEVTWRAAYECQFVDEAHALLPYELLTARVDDELDYQLDMKELEGRSDLYAGYDVGRKHDLSVLVVLKRLRDSYEWVGAIELRRMPFGEQSEILRAVLSCRSIRRLQIDQSGLGMQLAEELVARFGDHRVEPITMTMPVKESMASLSLMVFQRGMLSIPDHRPLIDDLHSVTRSITPSGNIRYMAPREEGSHADRWTALSLALQAAGNATGPIESLMDRVPSRAFTEAGAW